MLGRRRRIWYQVGHAPGGASNSVFVRWDDGQEYLVKCRALSPGQPYVASNEYIAARLADLMGLPILPHRIVEYTQGESAFGSLRIADPHAVAFDAASLAGAENPDVLYDMVAFDVWIRNTDRHDQNILVRLMRPNPPTYAIVLNDHSHCLCARGVTPRVIEAAPEPSGQDLIKSTLVRGHIADNGRMDQACQLVASVPDHIIDHVLDEVPMDWLTAEEKNYLNGCLRGRRDNIVALVARARS